MKKPEEVLGGSKKKKSASKKKGHNYSHTHIEHHMDGSHTVRHTPDDGGKEMSYAAPDMAGVHAGLDQNVGGSPAPMAEGAASPDMGSGGGSPALAALAGGGAPPQA